METLYELIGILTLGVLFWVRTGKLEAKVAEIAHALDSKDGGLTGDAVLERFEAVEMRIGKIQADLEEVRTVADSAKRSTARINTQLARDEEKLIANVTESILPVISQQITAMQQQMPTQPNGGGLPLIR